MKKTSLIQTFGLAAMSLALLSGCGGGDDSSSSSIPSSSSPSEDSSQVIVEDDGTLTEGAVLVDREAATGIHKEYVKVGKHYIEDYEILVANEPKFQSELDFAANELGTLIREATGVSLNVVTDEEYDASKHYLSIGKTKAYKEAMIDFGAEKNLGPSGVLIKSDKNNVYLVGGEPYGIMFSVYEFLEHEINFRVFGSQEVTYTRKTRLKVHQFNVVDVPDIALRIGGYGAVSNNSTLRTRMRLNFSGAGGKIWMGPDGAPYHNTFNYLNPDIYRDAHPDWYSDDQLQLCFTAHGNPKEQESMFNTFMKRFIDVVDSNPDCRAISITQQDGPGWCECDACSALKKKYGVDSAAVVMFCNKVSDALAEHFKQNNIKRDIDILFFAYVKTEDAPVKKDENGKWVPIDDQVVCRDNVAVFYAPIFADYRTPMDTGTNISYSTILEKWQACTNKTYLWIYGTDFHDYLLPMNNFTTMGENYRYAYEQGAVYLYDQGQWNQTLPTGWSLLKAFLQAELQWNVYLDQEKLTQEWFDAWFKEASEPMKAVFDAWNTYSAYTFETEGIGVPTFSDQVTTTMFPKSHIDFYLSKFEEAYKAIAPLADTDPVLYDRLKQRITLETISYRYIDHKLYKGYYSASERAELWEQFRSDVTTLGISHLAETVYISTLFEEF